MKMTFEKMWSLVEEINGLERDAEELRDRWDDWGASPGCECGCVPHDTEFFTVGGWKKISEYDNDMVLVFDKDKNTSYLSTPRRFIKRKSDGFLNFKARFMDMTVSPDHRVLYYTEAENAKVKTGKEVFDIHNSRVKGFSGRILSTIPNIVLGRGCGLSDEEIRVMVMVMADGSYDKNWNDKCRIAVSKERKKERIRKLLTDAKIEFKEVQQESRKELGYSQFYFDAPIKEKRISYFYSATIEQLKIVQDEIKYWDSDIENGLFCSKHKDDVDFVQFMHSCLGGRAYIYFDDREHSSYRTAFVDNKYVGFSQSEKATQVESEDGYEYCFTVDTGFFFIRQNGRIYATGNCGGDTFDWDGQSEAFHEANQLDREAFELREKIRLAWEAMCDAEGSNS